MTPDLPKGRRPQPAARADNAVRCTVGQEAGDRKQPADPPSRRASGYHTSHRRHSDLRAEELEASCMKRDRFMSNSSSQGRRKEPPGAGKAVKEEPFGFLHFFLLRI